MAGAPAALVIVCASVLSTMEALTLNTNADFISHRTIVKPVADIGLSDGAPAQVSSDPVMRRVQDLQGRRQRLLHDLYPDSAAPPQTSLVKGAVEITYTHFPLSQQTLEKPIDHDFSDCCIAWTPGCQIKHLPLCQRKHQLIFNNNFADDAVQNDLAVRNHAQRELPIRKIPDVMLFNDKSRLLDESFHKDDLAKNNVKHTIDLERIDHVDFLDNAGCGAAIEAAHSKLLAMWVEREQIETHKSDICRLAQLKLHGGYYTDSHLRLLQDIRNIVPPQASFASVISLNGDGMFQALIAAAPHHPVISAALDMSLSFYERRDKTLSDILDKVEGTRGTVVLRLAYEHWMGQSMRPGLHWKGEGSGKHDEDNSKYAYL